MCDNCKRELEEAWVEASEDLDARGVPEDSITRGCVKLMLAMNMNPVLDTLIREQWPSAATLLQ